jgi:hypothetical protein
MRSKAEALQNKPWPVTFPLIERCAGVGIREDPMRRTSLAAMAVLCCVCAAAAETADVEIGVLSCTLAVPSENPAGGTTSGGQTRDALCIFKLKSGAEETYAGKVEGVSITADRPGALLWLVKWTSAAAVEPGLLQQSYAADPAKPADQKPPLIGEANADVVLHFMADKREGSASAPEKPPPTGYVVRGVELELKSTSG